MASSHFAHRHQRLHVGKKPNFAGRGRRDVLASGPPDGGGLARHQRCFDRGPASARRLSGDQAAGEVDVGAITGNDQRQPHGTGGRNGKRERGASGFDAERQHRRKREREFSGPNNRCLDSVVHLQREILALLLGVDDGEAGEQRHSAGSLAIYFAVQFDGSGDGLVPGLEAEVGALHGKAHGRRLGLLHRFGGEFQQLVVFVEREGDVTRGGNRHRGTVLRRGAGGQQEGQDQGTSFHFAPPFRSF